MISVAMDAQGAEAARPWHEAAKATFPTLVDQQNVLGSLFGLKAIPYALLVNEAGILVKGPFSVQIEEPKTQAELERWLTDPSYERDLLAPTKLIHDTQLSPAEREAQARFELGSVLLSLNKKDEALQEWRKALALDPNNWIIHKQIWAVEHPERFYEGAVDYGWQKQQLEAEKSDAP